MEDKMEDEMGMEKGMEAPMMEGASEPIMGRFSATILNRAVAEVNKLLPLFDMPEYPQFEGEQSEIPAQFLTALEMVASAAEDYGQPEVFDLGDLQGRSGSGSLVDKDLLPMLASLRGLANDKGFKDFLAAPEQEEEPSGPARAPSAREMFLSAPKGKE